MTRTTLSIEPTVAQKLRKLMLREHMSLKVVINEVLREGLKVLESENEKKEYHFKVEPQSFGFRAGIDLDKLNQFADDMEDEEIVAKMQR